MTTSLQIYENQVLSFLQSCTIIFSPISEQMNFNLQNAGYAVDLTSPTTFKYYLNVSGQYHPVDTLMTILSLDTKQTVDFTSAMLAISPKTKAAYVIGSSYYTALCQAYPTQVDLIKSIVYPVDIDAAIAAPDFTLLGFGNNLLEANEQDAILYELNQFITYVGNRWYFSWLSYEAYAVWAFWAILWQSLPNAIFAARLKYLKTSSVNSFHIWNYLESNGIADYSDILTSEQALWLYRNIDYLNENKGKQSNLVVLVDNLLNKLNVGLVGKTIFMNTAINAATCQWTPEFVSKVVPTENAQSLTIVAPETMTELNAELVTAGFEVNTTPAYILEQQTLIGDTTLNTLPTKLVEIQQLGLDQKYGGVLNNFVLDTLVSMIVTGRYAPAVEITDPTTGITLSLSGQDALALYYYTIQRSQMQRPTALPTLYTPSCAFRYDVTANSFPKEYLVSGTAQSQNINLTVAMQSYLTSIYPEIPSDLAELLQFVLPGTPPAYVPTQSYLSIADMLKGLAYPIGTINDPEVFSTLVADLFLVLVRYIRYSRTQASQIALAMFTTYCTQDVLQTSPYRLALSTVPDYATWASNLGITTMLATLNNQTNYTTAFAALANTIMTGLIPEASAVYKFFSYTNQSNENLYDRLKSLFTQLCSYNIAFLDTNRVDTWWFLTTPMVAGRQSTLRQKTKWFDPTLQMAVITATTSGVT